MHDELVYRIALTLVPNIGPVHAKTLIGHFGNATAVFTARRKELESVEGIGAMKARCIKQFTDFSGAAAELAFIERYGITPLFLTDNAYPQRLLHCYDSPPLLYYRGQADLNQSRIVAVVGTRNNTEYGKMICEKFIRELSSEKIMVVSGLAFGIDSIAHKASLQHQLPTVGVLAHGLDTIYPAQNKTLARQMTEQGGLLTEFMSNSKPDRQNFPRRNRIVAGICDAIVVIESSIKGGSLITAELANGYNKDVFAIPGRTIDSKSEGCNYLIRHNKALLLTSANDLLEIMNWKPVAKSAKPQQRVLFVELSPDEQKLVSLLQQKEQCHIDELYLQSGLSSSSTAAALLLLEMQGLILSLPGKMYKLC